MVRNEGLQPIESLRLLKARRLELRALSRLRLLRPLSPEERERRAELTRLVVGMIGAPPRHANSEREKNRIERGG